MSGGGIGNILPVAASIFAPELMPSIFEGMGMDYATAGLGEKLLANAALGGGISALTGGNALVGALGGAGGALLRNTDMLRNLSLTGTPPAEGVDLATPIKAAPTAGASTSGLYYPDSVAKVYDPLFQGGYTPPAAAGTIGAQAGQTAMGAPGILGQGGNYGILSNGSPVDLTSSGGATAYEVANNAPNVANTAAQKAIASGDNSVSFFDSPLEWWKTRTPSQKLMYGGIGVLGASALTQPSYKMPELPKSNAPQFGLASNYAPVPNPTPVYPGRGYAEGGIAALAGGGDTVNFMGGDMYPQSQQQRSFYATPTQMPTSAQQAMASYEPSTNPLTGEPVAHMAHGGIANLGGYSDGGRLLRGPGDGMSDSIPASIGAKQPARLADGEFVVPADVVSHLGNGSTDAGAKHLYAMMDKVRKARTGTKKQGKQINPGKFMPA